MDPSLQAAGRRECGYVGKNGRPVSRSAVTTCMSGTPALGKHQYRTRSKCDLVRTYRPSRLAIPRSIR
jgi:hypothetical protein